MRGFVANWSYFLESFLFAAFNGTRIDGVLSPPHSLVVATHSATWVQLVWQPPLFAHPTDKITYRSVEHFSIPHLTHYFSVLTVAQNHVGFTIEASRRQHTR